MREFIYNYITGFIKQLKRFIRRKTPKKKKEIIVLAKEPSSSSESVTSEDNAMYIMDERTRSILLKYYITIV